MDPENIADKIHGKSPRQSIAPGRLVTASIAFVVADAAAYE
jgi:hypothetical protein